MSATPLDTGTWIPLMDYAMRNGVSLSTLRRHIKSGKLEHRSENGKYLVRSNQPWRSVHDALQDFDAETDAASADLESRVSNLETQLKRAQEEISELKMLVAIYEERLFQNLPSQL